MTVRIEKNNAVWTIIHSRFEEARNAMDPESADALVAADVAFHLIMRIRHQRWEREKDGGKKFGIASTLFGRGTHWPRN